MDFKTFLSLKLTVPPKLVRVREPRETRSRRLGRSGTGWLGHPLWENNNNKIQKSWGIAPPADSVLFCSTLGENVGEGHRQEDDFIIVQIDGMIAEAI